MVAQPGMAALEKNLMATIVRMANTERPIITIEKMSKRVAMISIKTPMAPNPCSIKEVKLILESPLYRLPLCVEMFAKDILDFMIAPARWLQISLV